jgi:DNA-binding NarL/FixJ family response regulator
MSLPRKITVLLVEDPVVVRHGLSKLIGDAGHCGVVGQARTGQEADKLAAQLLPDVILVDMAMPVRNGLEAPRQTLAAKPAAKVLVLSAHRDHANVDRMTAAGAVGFLEQQSSAAILIQAIHEVAGGEIFSARVSPDAWPPPATAAAIATISAGPRAVAFPPARRRRFNGGGRSDQQTGRRNPGDQCQNWRKTPAALDEQARYPRDGGSHPLSPGAWDDREPCAGDDPLSDFPPGVWPDPRKVGFYLIAIRT